MNMMTEVEARMVYCPVMMYLKRDNTAKCIASACAFWSWDDDEHGVCKQAGTGEPYRGCCGLIKR